MWIQVTDVEYKGEYTLKCVFNDGVIKQVDMSPILEAPVFRALKDKEQFRKFGLDETIFWSNGADIAPEWLYEHGVTCSE